MNKLTKIILSIVIIMSLSGVYSCTDLDEICYSTVVTDNYFNDEEEIISAMVPAYENLREFMRHRGILDLEEVTTDIMVTPSKDYGGWFDGGYFQKMHEHTWTSSTLYLENLWSRPFKWVNIANQLIYTFGKLDNMDPDLKDTFIGELSAIRAFGYYYLLNFFGNVPLVDDWANANPAPANHTDFYEGRKDVFEFIENELLNLIPDLSPNVDNTTYGRFNKWTSMMLLVKLYMNSEVWTGIPRWQDASDYCDSIINSGFYQLEPDYFTNFIHNNEISRENIFVFPNDPVLHTYLTSFEYFQYHQHFASGPVFGTTKKGNNGCTAIPSYIHSFHPDDLRLKGWTWGPQINKETGVVQMSNRAPYRPLIFTIDYINMWQPTSPVVIDYKNALENSGARMCKYQIVPWEVGTSLPNDHVVYRYADVLLLKAEALMRLNNGVATPEAVNLVNDVHKRAFNNPATHMYTTETLTMDALLQERAWELYWEGMRRNDLIRFGKFHNGTWEWYDRSSHGIEKTWYPIPQTEINTNPNLTQNPGYN